MKELKPTQARIASVLNALALSLLCLSLFANAACAQEADVTLFRKNGTEANWCQATNQIAYTTRGPDDLYGIHVYRFVVDDARW